MVVILVVYFGKAFLQGLDGFFDVFLLVFLESFLQVGECLVGRFELDATEYFAEVSRLSLQRHDAGYIVIDLLDYTLIVGMLFRFREVQETFFLFGLGFQYLVVDDSLVHTDGVLPVVGRAGILAGILDTYLVAGSHFLAQHTLAGFTHFDTRGVDGIHAEFHFAFGQVAAGASRESHNHGIIAFLKSLQRNRQELLHLKRHVVLAIVGRISVLVGINTEHGEIAGMARPHPVVGFTSELTQ